MKPHVSTKTVMVVQQSTQHTHNASTIDNGNGNQIRQDGQKNYCDSVETINKVYMLQPNSETCLVKKVVSL